MASKPAPAWRVTSRGVFGIDTLGEQDAGAIEQRLPGNAKQPAVQAGLELAVQALVVAVEGEIENKAD